MTAALYLLPQGTLPGVAPGEAVRLDGAEGHHAATVKRARVGDQLLLADGSGLRAVAEVSSVSSAELWLRVVSIEDAAEPGPRFVLAQALAKGGRDEQAVEAATELGADAVLAWQANRSVVVWRADRVERSLRKWQSVAAAAAKQSRRATVPEVSGPVRTTQLCQIAAEADLALVLHEQASTPLAGLELPADGDVLLVVGPEGGIADDELAALQGAGAVLVRLGSNVLRSSSAGPAALAVLNAASRWQDGPSPRNPVAPAP